MAHSVKKKWASGQGVTDALEQGVKGILEQILTSINNPQPRRSSIHLAVPLAARYIASGAAIGLQRDTESERESERKRFECLSGRLAEVAIAGAALFYYENCGQQAEVFSAPGPDLHSSNAEEVLVAAWTKSLSHFRLPVDAELNVRRALHHLPDPYNH